MLFSGLLNVPWWGDTFAALALTHVTIAGVTIYLHRCQAHRALDLHPAVANFFRFWLWLTTGMVTKEWVAVHRKHHAKCETAEDPQSPQIYGINRVLWAGVLLYVKESFNKETLERYGHGTRTTGSSARCIPGTTHTSASSACSVFTHLPLALCRARWYGWCRSRGFRSAD